jgi:hypothetical protein
MPGTRRGRPLKKAAHGRRRGIDVDQAHRSEFDRFMFPFGLDLRIFRCGCNALRGPLRLQPFLSER